MTPISPNPSVHDVVTNRWQPNQLDIDAGIQQNFATTVNILYGIEECGYQAENTIRANQRIEIYLTILNYLQGSVNEYGFNNFDGCL